MLSNNLLSASTTRSCFGRQGKPESECSEYNHDRGNEQGDRARAEYPHSDTGDPRGEERTVAQVDTREEDLPGAVDRRYAVFRMTDFCEVDNFNSPETHLRAVSSTQIISVIMVLTESLP